MSDFLKEYRAKYPQYEDINDDQLSSALNKKYNAETGANIPLEQFHASIGYAPAPIEPETTGVSLGIRPSEDQTPTPIMQQDEIAPRVREPGMKTIPSIEFERPMLDIIANQIAGGGERLGDIAGALVDSVRTVAADIDEKAQLGGLVWKAGDLLPSFMGAEEYAAAKPESLLGVTAEGLKNIPLGYKEQANWESVKDKFSQGGALSGSAFAEVLEYGAEQGIKSIPDMLATVYAMPAYLIARSSEIGDERARAKGKDKATSVDMLEAAPFAVASAMLERIGAKGMTSEVTEQVGKEMLKAGVKESAKRVAASGGKAMTKEAATEAMQEGMIEYVGERFGTGAKMDFKEALDRGLGAAVAGGTFGGPVGASTAIAAEMETSPQRELGKALKEDVKAGKLPSAEQAALAAMSPSKAQLTEKITKTKAFQALPAEDQAKVSAIIEEAAAVEPAAEVETVVTEEPKGERRKTERPFIQQSDLEAEKESAIMVEAGLPIDHPAHKALIKTRREAERASDPVTGLIPVKHFQKTMDRAWTEHQDSDRGFSYSEIDLRNLGGMNAKLGTSGADKHLKGISSIIKEEISSVSQNAQVFRKGGDEFGVVAPDLSAEEVNQALDKAQERVKLYAQENGLTDIPHTKEGRAGGIGLVFASTDFENYTDPESIRSDVDTQVEAKKKEVEDVDKGQVKEVGTVALGGQPGEVTGGTVDEAGGPGEQAGASQAVEETKVVRKKPLTPKDRTDRRTKDRPFVLQSDLEAEAESAVMVKAGLPVDHPAHQKLISTRREAERASDPVTGLIPVKHFQKTMDRAWSEHQETDRDFTYAEIDLRNLGGMNSKLGTSGADRHLKGIASIIKDEMTALSPDVQVFRKGGDEFGVVAPDLSSSEINQALERAKKKVDKYAADNKLSDIPHTKEGREGGIGIVFSATDFESYMDQESIRADVDTQVEAKKKQIEFVDKGQVEKDKAQREKKRNQVNPAKDDILKAISKLGGLDHAQVLSEWGKTVTDSTAELKKRGVFGKPIIRKTKGLKLDRMLESLKGNGYLAEDADINDLLTAFSDSMRGDLVTADAKEFDLPEQEVPQEIDADSPYQPVVLSDENLEAVGYNEFTSAEAEAYEDLVEALNNKEFTNNLIEELEGMPDEEYYETAGARIAAEIERVAAEESQRLVAEEQAKSAESSSKDIAPAEKQVSNYGTNAAESFITFRKTVADQTATVEDILADAKSLIANKEKILAQFSDRKFTKPMLQSIVRSPRSDWTKPQLVKQAFDTMLSSHVMADATITLFGSSQTYEEQIIEQLEKQTQADVDAAYEKQREYRADYLERKANFTKAMENPETLQELKTFVKHRGKEAFTVEQLARYDELVSESLRPEDRPQVVEGVSDVVSATRAETVHSKTGIPLYVVKLEGRVSKEKFNELRSKSKQFGGYYSAYSKSGAIPGFQFKTIEEADQFEQLLSGKDINKSDFAEAKAEVKQAKNADKLIEMADKLEAKANEEINRPRLANTAKRAGQASSATESAYKQLALAKTVRNIAIQLQSGELKHLGQMSQVTQLEELMSLQRRAMPRDFFTADYDGYSMNYQLKEGVTIDDYIANAKMPELTINRNRAAGFGRDLNDKKGFMRLAAEMKKLSQSSKEQLAVTPEQVAKINAAVKAGHISQYTLGYLPDAQKSLSRLKRLGITTDEQLRAAIRELDTLREEKQKEDPVKKLERDLIGKKIEGYFPTPKELVDQMIDYADIQPGHEVLEPSAGKGNIAQEIKTNAPNAILEVIEFNPGLRAILEAKGYEVVGNDFLQHKKKYDRIVMNPPFENFQDIDHVRHAFDLLKPGGKLVAIMGAGVKNSRAKAVEFREWVDEAGSYIEDLPEGSFKSSDRPTGVSTVMVTLEKNDTNTEEYKKLDSKRPAPVKENAAFKKWFGDSKVVDAHGNPQTVYHGSNKSISEFNTKSGAYFTEDTEYASHYAGEYDDNIGKWTRGKGDNVTPVYISIKNPKIFNSGFGNKPTSDNFYTLSKQKIAEYKKQGYDGLIFRSETRSEFVVFDKEQIKSVFNAIDNEVFHAPGHNYVGLFKSTGIPARREFVTIEGRKLNIPDKPQRIEPIMGKLVKIAGRRIYYGKIKGKSSDGFYRPGVGEIRTRKKNDVEVLAHELAHYIDAYSNVSLPNFQRLYKDPQYAIEVEALSYTDATKELQKIEGFAEFVRLWLTNSNEAQLRAPNFYEAFTNLLARDRKLLNPMRDMQDLMHKFYFQGPDMLGQALIGKDPSFIQRIDEWKYRRDSRIRQQAIDRFHAARKIEQELTGKIGDVSQSAWKQFRLSNGGAEGIADYILNYGTVEFEENGDLKKNGKSLHDILAPVKTIKLKPEHKGRQKIDLLTQYLAGRRALELHRQGRENLIPKETAMEWARLGKSYPVFESISKEYQSFNDRMLDFYEEAGMITPEGRKVMQSMNKDYVPFNRVRDQLGGGKGVGSGFQKLKGGTANLNDILVNIQDGITANVRAALNNRAKQRLYQYIAGHKDGAIFATRISPDSKPVQVYAEEMMKKINSVLDANGIKVEGALDMTGQELLTFWQHGVKPRVNESGNIVDSVIINGKPKYYEVQDPLLQDMLLSMNPESYSSFMNVMFGIKNFFTRTITLGVEFTGANLVRDTMGAAFLSKNNFIPFLTSFKGMYSFIAKDQDYQSFLRSGGGFSGRIEGMTKEGKARRRVKVDEFGVMSRPEKLLTSIDNIMSAFEYGTRIGEFQIAKKNNKSDMDAGFEAREISTDFAVMGANRFLTGYIRTVPFLNAMIQSQDRVFREAFVGKRYDGNPAGMAMKAVLGITIPTLALYLINKDDEDYQEIPDHERRTNWHFKVGDGQFVKIPRPYDVGFAYATMPELFFKYIEDEKGKEFADGMLWTMTQMYGIDGVPAMMTGWWDVVRNKKWTGAPVIPKSLADVEAPQQYTSNTSETFVRLGEATGMSPVKAEHMFKAYTGYLGGYAMWATDHMLWDEDKFGDKPDRKASANIFLRRFLTTDVRHSTATMEKFFDLKEKSDEIVATFKKTIDIRRAIKGKKEEMGKFKDDSFFGLSAKEKEVLFALNDSMNELIKVMYGKGGIKTAELAIKYDKNLTGAEKRDKIDRLWIQRNKAFMQYYTQAEKALQKAKREASQENTK